MVVQNFLSQILKKKVHPITGRSRGPLRNEDEQTAAPEPVDQAGDDPPTEDSQESGETPTNDDGIESDGGDASDEISGEDGRDDIDGGMGADLIDAGNGSDEVDGGKGDDSLDGGQGDDTLIGGLGDDTFVGGEGADLFDLSLGSDVIKDFNPEDGDRIILPDGQEFDLIQDGDDLVILLEDGSSRVLEGLSREAFEQQLQELILSLVAIKPVVTEIVLKDDDDQFFPEEATDEPLKIDALAGNDTVEASDGDDTLDGGDGDDTLIGGAGDDRMIGRRGNDLLIGGEGGDTYVLTRGNDTIEGFSLDQDRLLVLKGQKYASEEIDDERGQGLLINLFEDDENPKTDDPKSSTLILGIGKGELQAHNILIKSGDLEVPYSEAGDIKGVIKGSNDSDYERVDDDGVVEESGKGRLIGTKRDDVIAGRGGNDQLSGEEGDDILEGGEGVDTLLGGRGDDWLSGGGDSDVYIISRGNDTIDGFNKERDRVALLIGQEYETENTDQGLLVHLVDPDDDTIEHTTLFTGIQKGELTAENLLYINRAGRMVAQAASTVDDEGRLIIKGTEANNTFNGNDELDEFGSSSDNALDNQLSPRGVNIEGQAGNDILIGSHDSDEIKGEEDNDQLKGGRGNDKLEGGVGNDFLYGQGDDDHLFGESGDDLLSNGSGVDQETLNGGEGKDTFLIQAWGGASDELAATSARMATNTIIEDFGNGDDRVQLPIEYGYSNEYSVSFDNGEIIFQGDDWGFTIQGKDGVNVSELLTRNGIQRVAHDNRNTLVAKEYLGHLPAENTSGNLFEFDWTSDSASYEHSDGETYRNHLILMGGHDTIRGFDGTIDRIVKNGYVLQSISDERIIIDGIDGNEERIVINYKTPIEDDAERTLTLIDPILTAEQEDLLPSDQLLAVTDLDTTTTQQDVSGFPIDPLIVPEQSLNPVKNADEYQYSVNENIVSIQGLTASEDIRAIANDNPYAFYYDALLNPVGTPKNFELFDLPAYSINGGDGEDVIYGSTQNDTIDGGSQKDAIFALKGEDVIKVQGDQGVNDVIWGGDGFKQEQKLNKKGKSVKDSVTNQPVYVKTPEIDILLNASEDNQHLQLNGVVSNVITMNADNPLFDFDGTDGTDNENVKVEPNVNGIELIDLSEQDNPRKLLGTDKGNYFDLRGTSLLNLISSEEALGQDAADDEPWSRYSVALGDGDDLMYAPSSILDQASSDKKYSYQGWLGNDTIYGGKLGDLLFGGDDHDKLFGQGGNDEIDGESGDDRIHGHGGDDILNGGDGDDVLYGSGGNDELYGDVDGSTPSGEDYLHGGAGDDIYSGGGGRDRFLIKSTKIDKDESSETFGLSIHSPDALGENEILDFNIQEKGDYLLIVEPNNRVPSSKSYRYVLDDESPILLGGENVRYTPNGAENLVWQLDLSANTGLSREEFGRSGRIIHVSPEKTSDRTKVLFYGMNEGGDKGDEIQVIYPDWNKVKTKDWKLDRGKAEVHGLDGNDTLSGGAGLDSLFGENGADSLDGGAGDDFIVGGAQGDLIKGGIGDDRLDGNDHNDSIFGGVGSDSLRGMGHDDSLDGGVGDDTLDGGTGDDTLIGGEGEDIFVLSKGANLVVDFGFGGRNILRESDGNLNPLWDSVNPEVIEYTYEGETKPSTVLTYSFGDLQEEHTTILYGIGTLPEILPPEPEPEPEPEPGPDPDPIPEFEPEPVFPDLSNPGSPDDQSEASVVGEFPGESGSSADESTLDDQLLDGISADDNRLRIVTVEQNPDSEGFDQFTSGGRASQTMKGTKGTDKFRGKGGRDQLTGKQGNDYLYGGGDSDTLSGGSGTDVLLGRWGDDVLKGGSGNDLLYGGYQNDMMTGGPGQDVFLLSRESSGDVDVITDFNVAEDGIGLARAIDLQMTQEGSDLRITGLYGVNTLLLNVQKSDFLSSFPDNLSVVPVAQVEVI